MNNTMNPAKVAANRTARLVREAKTPTYSTDTRTAKAKAAERFLANAEELSMSEDFCHICGRATDHRGEHDDAQILEWAQRGGLLQSLL